MLELLELQISAFAEEAEFSIFKRPLLESVTGGWIRSAQHNSAPLMKIHSRVPAQRSNQSLGNAAKTSPTHEILFLVCRRDAGPIWFQLRPPERTWVGKKKKKKKNVSPDG